jgi:hypothetical protein
MRVPFSILILWIAVVLPATAQVTITLELLSQTPDSTIVAVNMGQPELPLSAPVSSFQFRVDMDSPSLVFRGLITDWTLSGKPGWTSRANPENGKTGGFSSSLDAIEKGGVLTLLYFHRKDVADSSCADPQIKLSIFKLNSGRPAHSPAVPTLRLPVCEGNKSASSVDQ